MGAVWGLAGLEDNSSAFGGFRAGLTRPSLLAVLVCGVVVLAGVLLYLLAAPWAMRSEFGHRFLFSSAEDNQTLVSHAVLKGLPPNRAAVIPLGTSLIVHCVDPRNDLDAMIEAATGRPVHVAEFATSAQTSWEMAAILDRAEAPEGSLVILGMSYGLLGVPLEGPGASTLQSQAKNPKMAFRSDAFDAEVADAGLEPAGRTGFYGLDNAPYFLARRKEVIKNALRGGGRYGDPLDVPWYRHVATPEAWAAEKESLPNLDARYEASAALHFDVLARMIEREDARGVDFVIAEAPINPEWLNAPGGPAFIERFQADIRDFATEKGLPFAALNEMAALVTADFVDMEGHVKTEEARARCTDAIGQVAIATLGGGQ